MTNDDPHGTERAQAVRRLQAMAAGGKLTEVYRHKSIPTAHARRTEDWRLLAESVLPLAMQSTDDAIAAITDAIAGGNRPGGVETPRQQWEWQFRHEKRADAENFAEECRKYNVRDDVTAEEMRAFDAGWDAAMEAVWNKFGGK